MLREGTPADHAALAEVMYEAVRTGPSRYAEAQREAWVPAPRSGPSWTDRLAAQTVILDEDEGGVRGFMTFADGGYVDFAYIRPAAQRSGLFRRLLGEIVQRAEARGLDRLWVHASLTAEPAFSACGFTIVRRETVELGGRSFDRFEMERTLGGA